VHHDDGQDNNGDEGDNAKAFGLTLAEWHFEFDAVLGAWTLVRHLLTQGVMNLLLEILENSPQDAAVLRRWGGM
jgi:hypothetical protein